MSAAEPHIEELVLHIEVADVAADLSRRQGLGHRPGLGECLDVALSGRLRGQPGPVALGRKRTLTSRLCSARELLRTFWRAPRLGPDEAA